LFSIVATRKTSTAEDYAYIARRYIIPHLGRIRLCDLNAAHIRRWLNILKAQKVQPQKQQKRPLDPNRTLSRGTIQNAYRRLAPRSRSR
jgi:hypothetical protein